MSRKASAIFLLILWALLLVAPFAFGQRATRVTVHFADGTSQEFGPPPATAPAVPATPPAPQPATLPVRTDAVTLWDNAVLEDVAFDVSGPEGTRAIYVRGKNVTVRNVESRGTAIAIELRGANGVRASGIRGTSGLMNDKAVYSGGANRDVVIENFDFFLPGPWDDSDAARWAAAEHGLRFHGWEKFVLRNGRVAYLNHRYKGAAINIKSGDDFLIENVRIDGPVGVGPLDTDYGKVAGWEQQRARNVRFVGCEINTPGYLRFWPGCEQIEVRDCTVRAVRWPTYGETAYDRKPSGTCLDLNGARGPWPAASGVFVNVKFEGTALLSPASLPNVKHWRFINCTFNGQPIGETGEMN